MLLNKGANPNIPDHDGYTPLHYLGLISLDHERQFTCACAKLLLSNGADPNIKNYIKSFGNSYTPLMMACYFGNNLELAEMLVKSGADVCCEGKAGASPLDAACSKRNLEMVEMLVEAGADVNITRKDGDTLLMHECGIHPNWDMAQLLVELGADVNAGVNNKDVWRTPLQSACRHGHLKTVELMLANGADINAHEENGRTVLYTNSDGTERKLDLAVPTPLSSQVPPKPARLVNSKQDARKVLRDSLKNLGLLEPNSKFAGSVASSSNHDRFNGKEYLYGKADNLDRYMCVNTKSYYKNIGRGVVAIIEEINTHGTEEDKECLHYILHEEAGRSDKVFQDGMKRDCDESGNVLPSRLTEGALGICDCQEERARGMVFNDFVEEGAKRGLEPAHVLSLRLYTTAVFKSINNGLRDNDRRAANRECPFCVLVFYIQDALDRLRFNVQDDAKSLNAIDLWRGMADIFVPANFMEFGGAELAPMSTTTNLDVALRYALRGTTATLFCIKASTYFERGVDIAFVSCFPGESEYLYRPITTLLPRTRVTTGKPMLYELEINGKKITVLVVEPKK